MKKLMTVSKSKYYMLKVNYQKIFEEVDFEIADAQSDHSAIPKQGEEERVYTDLKRSAETGKAESVAQEMMRRLKSPINVSELGENLNSEEAVKKRQEIIEKDKAHKQKIEEFTSEIVKAMEGTKAFDKEYQQSGYSEQFKNLKYVEREEDPELKELYMKEQAKFRQMSEEMKGKIDGELDMDLHGNITFRPPGAKQSGITDAGTYILRDGKLVKGKAEVREQAQFSNWYCSNADPEDIRRHRELMDRMHYRGPKWEGIGIPKSIIEEEDPVYKNVEADEHPSISHPDEEGRKEFEHVVR